MREKVIKGLECCNEFVTCKANCPYRNDGCREILSRNAIALLKEDERAIKFQSDRLDALLKAQEPVEPIRDINGVYYCGNCDTICVGYEVEFTHSIIKVENYCHKCGRKVKWE